MTVECVHAFSAFTSRKLTPAIRPDCTYSLLLYFVVLLFSLCFVIIWLCFLGHLLPFRRLLAHSLPLGLHSILVQQLSLLFLSIYTHEGITITRQTSIDTHQTRTRIDGWAAT